VHVAAPAPLLRHGLRLVDTAPAVAVLSSGALSTVHALAFADAVLFVTDASQELTRAEVDFLALAARMCPTVRCVLTKVDLYPDWRRIRELDASHLRAAGLADTVMPVSAALHGAGAVDESGVPAVASWLANELAGSARQGEIALAAEAARVADQLAVQFEAERSVLSDPGAAASLLEALDAARARSESLRATGARWQVALDDGFNDLFAEVDRDLRARLLEVERWADEAVEGLDPARGCDELERSVRQMMATGVAASYALLHDRAGALVARVAELVDAEVAAVAAPGGEVPTPAVQGGFGAVVRRPSWISLGVTALRGTSEGVVIAGMFGALAGVVLAMPLMMVAGVVIGARGVHDENERLLAERREKTKAAVHRYLEEVTVNVANDAPASLRHLQRELRDELQSRAEAAHRSASEAVAAAGAAAAAAASARKRRLAAVEAELARVEGLRRRAEQLVPA
jgi:hypothetical protein